jgi:hypothetical protein
MKTFHGSHPSIAPTSTTRKGFNGRMESPDDAQGKLLVS